MIAVDPSAATAAEDGRPAAPGAAGQSLGKYRLDRVIGSGGMGIVWAAFDPDLERAVALKLLRCADSEMTLRSRLLREARAMARLKHPSVLTVYEVGTDQNRDYIAMELVDGDNLSAWLDTRPQRAEILDALLAAGRGLAAAHAGGLVHRDFKPHNVLRSKLGHVYVTDFGLARGQIEEGCELEQGPVSALPDDLATGSQPRRPRDSVLDSPLTQTGVMIGTPAYMAPEQFAGRAPDPRSDQFAFCVTAWEALTGARPFRGATLEELEAAVGGGVEAAADERSTAGGLPPRLRAVLVRGLEPKPEARWPDMPALLDALTAAIAPPARRKRRVAIAAVIGAVALTSGVAIAVVAASRSSAVPARVAGAGGDCEPPETAFDTTWSPSRKLALKQARAGGERLGATILLDQLRREWTRSYRATCAGPRTAQRHERLACLLEVRDDAKRVVAELADRDSEVDTGELGALVAAVMMCDPDRIKDFDMPSIQWGPVPPVPPVPPAKEFGHPPQPTAPPEPP